MRLLTKILVLLVVVCVTGGGVAAAVPGRTFGEKRLWLGQVKSGGNDAFLGLRVKPAGSARFTGGTGKTQQLKSTKTPASQKVVVQEADREVKAVERDGQGTGGKPRIITGDEKARAIEQEVFRLLNEVRKAAGVPPVVWFEPVAEMAREKSRDAFETGELMHFSKRLGFCTDMYNRAGLRYTAANEVGVLDPERKVSVKEIAQRMMQSWLTSPPHRKTILGKEFKMAGVGVAWSTSPVPVGAKVGIKSLEKVDTYTLAFILFITLADE
ncbi:MAG: CAP domain-containing protein [Bacillota bacterium]